MKRLKDKLATARAAKKERAVVSRDERIAQAVDQVKQTDLNALLQLAEVLHAKLKRQGDEVVEAYKQYHVRVFLTTRTNRSGGGA